MDITEMLDLLVIDLKMVLDTTISTAEGTRAIQRAVDELSRHIPRERIYDHTWVKAVTDDTFTTPATEDPDYIVDNMDLPDTVVDGSTASLTATPWFDVARPITFTLTDVAVTRMTLVVKGTDADGVYREERFYRHNGKVQTGKINFYFIEEIEFSEIAGNVTGDKLDVGSAEPDLATGGIWVQLDNPIEPATEVIWSGAAKTGTKYKLGTDYEMDYANGRIRMVNGGSLVDGTTYYASYDKAQTSIDISSITPELLRISKVLYPADKVPEQQVSFGLWEDMLIIGSLRTGASQTSLTDGEHIAIYYEARQSPPSTYGPGSYPEFLDEVVLQGAGGFALLMEAIQYELAAADDLDSITNATTGALFNAEKWLANNAVTVGADAAGMLEDITTTVAVIRTKIVVAINAMATELGKVFTSSLDKATTGAEAYLDTGDDTINKLNDGGPDVPTRYSDYTRARAQLAQIRITAVQGYGQEVQMRFADLNAYIAQAEGYDRIAEDFIAQATRFQEAAGLNLLLADRFRAEAQTRLAEFRTMLSSRSEYRRRVVSTSVRQPA